MTVAVVTGGSGFIGSHLLDRLAASGQTAVNLDRSPVPSRPTIVTDLAAPSSEAVEALHEADVVFHLAGCTGVRTSRADLAARRVLDNVVACSRVLAHTRPSTPVVVASSSSVYGDARTTRGGVRGSREDDPLRPRGGYGRSKVALERLCAHRVARGGLVAVARPFTVAGEGQRPDMAIARWIHQLRAGRPAEVLGSIRRRRDITDVRDVVEGLVRLAGLGRPAVVNLGTGRSHTLGEILAAVAAALGVEPIVALARASHEEAQATAADTRRCRDILDLTPSTDLDGTVRRQVARALATPSTSRPAGPVRSREAV